MREANGSRSTTTNDATILSGFVCVKFFIVSPECISNYFRSLCTQQARHAVYDTSNTVRDLWIINEYTFYTNPRNNSMKIDLNGVWAPIAKMYLLLVYCGK